MNNGYNYHLPRTTLCCNCGQRITEFHLPLSQVPTWKHDGAWEDSPCKQARPEWFWTSWVGRSDAGPPVMWMKKLFTFRGWTVFLHKIVGTDHLDCFHTHPATAYRLILWGGYMEQLEPTPNQITATLGENYLRWFPLMFGKVLPTLSHRIHHVYGRRCLTLWIRGPVTHKIMLRGEGWRK